MDLQQIISRMPAATISDLQKGDAVMLVGTEATSSEVTAITLLAGVEPILQRIAEWRVVDTFAVEPERSTGRRSRHTVAA